jgi:hypothetical protein
MGNTDPFDMSRTVTDMPAVFSYVPEGNINFLRDDVLTAAFGQNNNPAIAKLGTLTLAGWNTGDDVTFRRTNQSDRNSLKVFDPDNPDRNFICNLYMGFGESGKTKSPVAFNSVTLTYTDKKGKTGSFVAKMYSRANISSGTSYRCLAGNANDNNPNLFDDDSQEKIMKLGETIDFYLIFDAPYTSLNNKINGSKSLSIEGNVRNIFQWVYRLNHKDSYTDRYYTNEDITTDPIASLINRTGAADDIVFNGTSRPKDDWSFSLFPTYFAQRLAITDQKQKIADATLVYNSGLDDSSHYVIYSIEDTVTDDASFRLHRVDDSGNYISPEDSIPYDLYFTRHSGTDPIVENQKYLFEMPEGISLQNAEMYVGDLAQGAVDAASGTWKDVITVTIQPVDKPADYNR